MDLKIKKAETSDIKALVSLDARCNNGTAFWDVFVWQMAVKKEGIYFYPGKNGTALGYIYISSKDQIFNVNTFEVDPAWRGLGIGKSLLKYVADMADESQKSIRLSVDRNNNYAQKLYKAFNFQAQPPHSDWPSFSVEMIREPKPKPTLG